MAKKQVKKTAVKVKKATKGKPAKKPVKKAAAKKKTGKTKRGNDKVDLECFLTTACMHHKNLPDDCKELNLLRKFRDNFMRQSEPGYKMVEQYYSIGPGLVQTIEKDPGKSDTYAYIYACIQEACAKIEMKENKKAQKVYEKMVKQLSKKYKAVE